MSDTLRTERLTFRRFQRADAERLAVLVNDIEIARWIGPMPHPYSLEMAHDYLDHVIGSGEDTFALEYEGHLVGAIGIRLMLGFWLAREHWGKGLMTEAAFVLLHHHFAGGAAVVTSGYHAGNDASARVHEKLGFRPNGSSAVFSQALGEDVKRHELILTADDWKACT
ncbi:GNAT family N-acetyltransferase [Sulfitobacter sp. JB4-11]|uniref:GNAT family N-acetyltransferase n=1 Tax=Sulfitobacter rhodophyticola TaxID=3238304 RepID=UPI003A6177F4